MVEDNLIPVLGGRSSSPEQQNLLRGTSTTTSNMNDNKNSSSARARGTSTSDSDDSDTDPEPAAPKPAAAKRAAPSPKGVPHPKVRSKRSPMPQRGRRSPVVVRRPRQASPAPDDDSSSPEDLLQEAGTTRGVSSSTKIIAPGPRAAGTTGATALGEEHAVVLGGNNIGTTEQNMMSAAEQVQELRVDVQPEEVAASPSGQHLPTQEQAVEHESNSAETEIEKGELDLQRETHGQVEQQGVEADIFPNAETASARTSVEGAATAASHDPPQESAGVESGANYATDGDVVVNGASSSPLHDAHQGQGVEPQEEPRDERFPRSSTGHDDHDPMLLDQGTAEFSAAVAVAGDDSTEVVEHGGGVAQRVEGPGKDGGIDDTSEAHHHVSERGAEAALETGSSSQKAGVDNEGDNVDTDLGQAQGHQGTMERTADGVLATAEDHERAHVELLQGGDVTTDPSVPAAFEDEESIKDAGRRVLGTTDVVDTVSSAPPPPPLPTSPPEEANYIGADRGFSTAAAVTAAGARDDTTAGVDAEATTSSLEQNVEAEPPVVAGNYTADSLTGEVATEERAAVQEPEDGGPDSTLQTASAEDAVQTQSGVGHDVSTSSASVRPLEEGNVEESRGEINKTTFIDDSVATTSTPGGGVDKNAGFSTIASDTGRQNLNDSADEDARSDSSQTSGGLRARLAGGLERLFFRRRSS
ncbi:unnamed protein product [Amoebophrya sp. A120]|nr:unnamed protein product [Amoebophrya sp. A120]|eukprot:GSA120T00008883001.1